MSESKEKRNGTSFGQTAEFALKSYCQGTASNDIAKALKSLGIDIGPNKLMCGFLKSAYYLATDPRQVSAVDTIEGRCLHYPSYDKLNFCDPCECIYKPNCIHGLDKYLVFNTTCRASVVDSKEQTILMKHQLRFTYFYVCLCCKQGFCFEDIEVEEDCIDVVHTDVSKLSEDELMQLRCSNLSKQIQALSRMKEDIKMEERKN